MGLLNIYLCFGSYRVWRTYHRRLLASRKKCSNIKCFFVTCWKSCPFLEFAQCFTKYLNYHLWSWHSCGTLSKFQHLLYFKLLRVGMCWFFEHSFFIFLFFHQYLVNKCLYVAKLKKTKMWLLILFFIFYFFISIICKYVSVYIGETDKNENMWYCI